MRWWCSPIPHVRDQRPHCPFRVGSEAPVGLRLVVLCQQRIADDLRAECACPLSLARGLRRPDLARHRARRSAVPGADNFVSGDQSEDRQIPWHRRAADLARARRRGDRMTLRLEAPIRSSPRKRGPTATERGSWIPACAGMNGIARRDFLLALAGGAAAWPLAAMAQQGERMRRVGMLMPYEQADPEAQARNAAIREVLKELGWSEGRNVEYHFRWAGNDAARLRTSAADLVGLRPDVILAPSTIATEALRQATSAIPIVFVNVLDPVASGFVASLARPGGNVTGFATVEPSIGGKWLELLIAIAPATKQVAILFSARSFSMAPVGPLAQTFDTAAPVFPALKLIRAPVQDIAELDSVIAAHGGMLGNGLIVAPEPFTSNHYEAITALAARYRLPAVYPYRFFAASGGLLSYGIDLVTQYRQAGTYVDRILKGAKPGDLPVQLPTKFELVINLKTAKAPGIEVPPPLLPRPDHRIHP